MVRVVYPPLKYSVQLPDTSWSEWRNWDMPIKEPHILSIRVSENLEWSKIKDSNDPVYKQYRHIMAQINV